MNGDRFVPGRQSGPVGAGRPTKLLKVLTVVVSLVLVAAFVVYRPNVGWLLPEEPTVETGQDSRQRTPGEDSHTFEGEGNGENFTSELVELGGNYIAKWEVSGNADKNGEGVFDADLAKEKKGGSVSVAGETVSDGSGKRAISIDEPGQYALKVYARAGHWKVTLKRKK